MPKFLFSNGYHIIAYKYYDAELKEWVTSQIEDNVISLPSKTIKNTEEYPIIEGSLYYGPHTYLYSVYDSLVNFDMLEAAVEKCQMTGLINSATIIRPSNVIKVPCLYTDEFETIIDNIKDRFYWSRIFEKNSIEFTWRSETEDFIVQL